MEIRVLRYFLAVAREGNIAGAAAFLHLTQPTLSRQIRDLEEELGQTLLVRKSHGVALTAEGVLFRKRAEEIMNLVQKTEREIAQSDEYIGGDIYIGAGETEAIRLIAKAAKQLQTCCPDVHCHITSGDAADVTEWLDKGLIDFGVLFDPADMTKYESIRLPFKDVWGVLMRKDAPLASQPSVAPEDLWDKPLIMSRQQSENSGLGKWLKKSFARLNITATYSLIFNASLLADEGIGYALTLDRLINTTGASTLCFRPLNPPLEAGMSLVWKQYQVFTKASGKFLETLREILHPRT